jgi:AraC-like DNA-binding protein
MLYSTHNPGPPLAEFVECVWLFEGAHTARKERILPSGTMELVVNLREDEVRVHDPTRPERCRRFSGAVISGTYSSAFVVDAMQHESMLGVHFKPGGAFPFLGALASELTDAHADLSCLWGDTALELRERLCEARTPRERFRVVEEVLATRLRRGRKHHLSVRMALDRFAAAREGISVRDVAREVGLCQRRFIQVFTSEVGLAPKLFSRVLRFQRARRLAKQVERVDWARLALSCGYFDQAHLINEFREFTGLSPTNYLRLDCEDERLKANHVPLIE